MHLIPMVTTLLASPAFGAEVVWPVAPDGEVTQQVGTSAEATGPALSTLDLRAAAHRWSAADDDAYAALDAALRDVRAFETKLDGELIIMEDLEAAIDAIRIIRDENDLAKMFSALAYQGFAVDRFFADTLESDDRAAPYRTDLTADVVELPWVDAVALAPDREVTPYDISEAPQRLAYTQVQTQVNNALPARLVPVDFPDDATVVVDGRPADVATTGIVTVPPGRHFVHVERNGTIIEAYVVRLQAGERREISNSIDEQAWVNFLRDFDGGNTPPASPPSWLMPSLEALGGEVWLAAEESRGIRVWKLSPTAITEETLKLTSVAGSDSAMWTPWARVAGGWMTSADFYLQDPENVEPTAAAVNAWTMSVAVGLDANVGPLRVGAGIDVQTPMGADHLALTGDGAMRVRPTPHLAAGIPALQVTAGFMFPYHVVLGATTSIPLVSGAELRAGAVWGPGPSMTRDDGSTWEGSAVGMAWTGIGWRIGG